MNNLATKKSLSRYNCALFIFCLILISNSIIAQKKEFDTGKIYTLGGVTVTGNTNFNSQTILAYSGLTKGTSLKIPGDKISTALKKLWNSHLFSNIDIYLLRTEEDVAFLEINLTDVPELHKVSVLGLRKGKTDEIIKDNNLEKGVKVTQNLITTTRNYINDLYKKKGFLNSKVAISTPKFKDSSGKQKVNMFVKVDRGRKVKVKKIVFNGNQKLKNQKLRKAMKNTKRKRFLRFYKRSKYIADDYKEDLKSVIDKYKENGYRDARILSDTVIREGNNLTLKLDIEEGEIYKFGKITFIGNTVYTDHQLKNYLKIEEGTTYNGILLKERIADNSDPDADDLTNLYQNNGYLFSSINPVEISAEGKVIDTEIRITEGKPTYINRVTVKGNDKTNDRIIYRELMTRPGQLYSKANIIRSIRELGQLGYFDAQQLAPPEFKNPNPNEGSIDLEYKVVEVGTGQLQLQGGYGGNGFVGTLGLQFSNFSLKDIFNKDAYRDGFIPMGDGQTIGLNLQVNRSFRTYSLNFIEPWLGGKKPIGLSTRFSYTQQFLFNPVTRDVDKDRRFNIIGATVGISKRLTVPDDYFRISHALTFQHYNLKNYNTGLFTFGNGFSNNLAYTVGLARNNTYTDPIYPMGGSNFIVSGTFTLPYSLFNGVNYKGLNEERDTLDLTSVYDVARLGEIDQERFNWLEYYKIKAKGDWYTKVVDKLVFKSGFEFGFLGAYNNERGMIPFERFFVGGDGLGGQALDGREVIQLRGYPNQSLSSNNGGTVYNKFSLELRYPLTLGQQTKIYGLGFVEGGNSFDNFIDFNPFNMKRSAGFGVRIFMPAFGLLGIDFGHGYDAIPGLSTKNGWETHFILRQQF